MTFVSVKISRHAALCGKMLNLDISVNYCNFIHQHRRKPTMREANRCLNSTWVCDTFPGCRAAHTQTDAHQSSRMQSKLALWQSATRVHRICQSVCGQRRSQPRPHKHAATCQIQFFCKHPRPAGAANKHTDACTHAHTNTYSPRGQLVSMVEKCVVAEMRWAGQV